MKARKPVPAKNIDEYLDALPEKVHRTLEKLRQTIKSVAPEAEESISYQIPSFKFNGMLVGFAAFKDHCSFFVMSASILKPFREELKSYDTAAGTIRFEVEKPLPTGLVKKLVMAKMKENETRRSAKKTS